MARTVELLMKVFRVTVTPSRSASRATRTAASREWPPRSKKLSSTRHQLQGLVQHEHPGIPHRPSDRHRVRDGPVRAHLVVQAADRGLGRPVVVDQGETGMPLAPFAQQRGRRRLPADHQLPGWRAASFYCASSRPSSAGVSACRASPSEGPGLRDGAC
jgi:hypothetical protein